MEVDETNDSSMTYKRTTEDIKSMVKLAKLNEKHLTELTQAIYYGESDTDGSKFKLLELNGHLLSAIEEGQTLQFKGGLNEKVVLCTDSKTFEVKEAGISNSLLIVPDLKLGQATSTSPLKSPKNAANSSLDKSANTSTESVEDEDMPMRRHQESRLVKKICHEYFECREVNPKFRKLGDLLHLTQYSGPENEHYIDRALLFTFDQLLSTTQCSRKEFENGLRLFRALTIDNRVRVLDIDYEYRLLSLMLGIVTENSWPLERIDREETLASISETIAPAHIVASLFDLYTKPGASEGTSTAAKIQYTYDEAMVCRTIALNMLQQGTKFHLKDFMDTWQSALPDGMVIDEEYLRGIGIIDRSASSTPYVRALIESSLSTNLLDRLKILFKARDRWTLDQIKPYIEFFATPQLTVTSILAKYARSMTENGQRIYVCKHGL